MIDRMKAIIKKEFLSYINTPVFYVVVSPLLALMSFLYFREVFILGDANLRPFVDLLPWFLLLLAPALSMRVFSEEYRKDTIELLFAHPLSEWAVVLSKYIGLLLFYGLFLGTTVGLPLVIAMFSEPDFGLFTSQYMGALLSGGAFLAIGMMSSAFIGASVGSFLVAAITNFVLLLLSMNLVLVMLPGFLSRFVAELGVLTHLSSFGRGVVDLRDVLYFLSVIGLALLATVIKLSSRRLSEHAAERRKLSIFFGLSVVVMVLANVVLQAYPIRIDLTKNQRYSLSVGTRKLLKELPDRAIITLITSENLPGALQTTLQEASDRIKDFRRYSDNIELNTIVVSADGENRNEALERGIQEVQFNQVAAGSFQVQTGFLGLHLRYGSETISIPFISDAANLEYELSRTLLQLTRDELPVIGFIDATNGQPLANLRGALADQYELLSYETATASGSLLGVLVVDDASGENATASAQVAEYVQSGGNALIFVDGVSVDPQTLVALPSESAFIDILPDIGNVSVNKTLAYDLQLHELIRMPGQAGGQSYILPYPFWIRSIVSQPPWGGAGSGLLGWPSTLEIRGDATPLLTTSQNANIQSSNFLIRPEQVESLAPASGEAYVLGAQKSTEQNRVVVIADSNVVTDEFLQNSAENAALVANLVDWVMADEILQSIPSRDSGRNVFVFSSPTQLQLTQYAAIFLPSIALAAYGIGRLRKRKLMSRRSFS